jgi:hypothetical protein
MPVIAFLFSATGQQTWSVEQDCVLTGIQVVGGNVRAILSSDPNATGAQFSAPSANAIDKNLIATAGVADGQPIGNSYLTPVSAGEKILVAMSGAGTTVIFYEISAQT